MSFIMQGQKMVESHIVEGKVLTPSKSHFIQLSPKRSSKRKTNTYDKASKIQMQNSHSVGDVHNIHKQNKTLNFSIVNIPIRQQKPFQKIPSYKNDQIIVRTSANPQTIKNESTNKRKKILVTKLFGQNSKQKRREVEEFVADQQL